MGVVVDMAAARAKLATEKEAARRQAIDDEVRLKARRRPTPSELMDPDYFPVGAA
jgi:hypothetical protein